jgi:hypothetical protein
MQKVEDHQCKSVCHMFCIHVKRVSCHHDMTHLEAMMEKIAVDIDEAHYWTADKGWSFSLGVW